MKKMEEASKWMPQVVEDYEGGRKDDMQDDGWHEQERQVVYREEATRRWRCCRREKSTRPLFSLTPAGTCDGLICLLLLSVKESLMSRLAGWSLGGVA